MADELDDLRSDLQDEIIDAKDDAIDSVLALIGAARKLYDALKNVPVPRKDEPPESHAARMKSWWVNARADALKAAGGN